MATPEPKPVEPSRSRSLRAVDDVAAFQASSTSSRSPQLLKEGFLIGHVQGGIDPVDREDVG
jgi:hypothetical protein